MVQQTIWPRNHTSHTKVYFNEFVANVLRDDMGLKISHLRKKGLFLAAAATPKKHMVDMYSSPSTYAINVSPKNIA